MKGKVYIISQHTENSSMPIFEVWGNKESAKKRVDELNKPYYASEESDEWYELDSYSVIGD